MNDKSVTMAIASMSLIMGLVACCTLNSCVAKARSNVKAVTPIIHSEPKETKPYVTKLEFDERIWKPGITYLLFGGEYCVPCLKLNRLLTKADLVDHKDLITINTEEPWAKKLASLYDVSTTPTIVIFKGGHWTGEMRIGLNSCLIFLLANLNEN